MPSGPSSSSTPRPAIILLPLFLARWRQQRAGGFWLFAIGLSMALTQFFYSLSFLHTEIVRAMILFYFNPVWATIMARVFLGEAITPIRWLAIAVAFSGMFIILGIDQGFPWPRNWRRLGRRRGRRCLGLLHRAAPPSQRPETHRPLPAEFHVHRSAAAHSAGRLPAAGGAPPLGLVVNQLWWLLPFIFLIAMPGVYLSMWAVPLLAPAIVGVLYMTEISAAAISSALWSGEPFGIREILGIALITVAAVLESVRDLWRDRRLART